MKKIVLIFQEIIKFFLIFLLIFVWMRLFFSMVLSIVCASALTIVFFLISFFVNRKKNKKNSLKMKEKTEAEDMFISLAIDGGEVDFFFKLAKKKHENVTRRKTYIVVNHEQEGVKTVLFPDASVSAMTIERLTTIYQLVRKENMTKIVICCYEYGAEITSFLENFKEKILIFDRFETYQNLFKTYDFYPEITRKISEKKMTRKDLFALIFSRKKTKSYLLSALALVFCSLFVPSSIYYCVFASILIVFAIISLFQTRTIPLSAQEIL